VGGFFAYWSLFSFLFYLQALGSVRFALVLVLALTYTNRRRIRGMIIITSIKYMKQSLRSSHGFTLVEIMIVVVIIGLLAAMAIPAFQKVRQSSQDKAVLNNARQLSGAADQYFLENGVTTVSSANLVGSDKYVKAVNTVAGETYPTNYTQGITITISGIAGSRTVTYAP
jgi:type IV pilus assembly protein PilA